MRTPRRSACARAACHRHPPCGTPLRQGAAGDHSTQKKSGERRCTTTARLAHRHLPLAYCHRVRPPQREAIESGSWPGMRFHNCQDKVLWNRPRAHVKVYRGALDWRRVRGLAWHAGGRPQPDRARTPVRNVTSLLRRDVGAAATDSADSACPALSVAAAGSAEAAQASSGHESSCQPACLSAVKAASSSLARTSGSALLKPPPLCR